MEIEIRFIDRQGSLCCAMSAGFISCEAAARYAREVMKIRLCRHYASAEICALDSLDPLVIAQDSNPQLIDLRGQIRRGKGEEKIVSIAAARRNRGGRIRPALRAG